MCSFSQKTAQIPDSSWLFPAKPSKKLAKPRYFSDFPPKSLQKLVLLQKFFRNFLNKRRFKRSLRFFRHRRRVFQEILATERSYAGFLSIIIKEVLLPAQNPCNFARFFAKNEQKRDEFLKIFAILPSLLTLHEKLAAKLAEKLNNFSNISCVGPIFQEFLPFFKLYFPYCEEFEQNLAKLQEIREKTPILREFLQKLEGSSQFLQLDLASLLIMPVQRICKYVIFFKELLRNLCDTHPDFAFFAENLRKIKEINEENNQKMNKNTKNRKLLQLQREFGQENPVFLTNRDFLFEESLEILQKGAVFPVIAYFLSDLVLVVERNTMLFLGKLAFFLELDRFSKVKSLQDTKYFSNLFCLQGKGGSVVTFVAENLESKQKLLQAIGEILEKLRRNAGFSQDFQENRGFQKAAQIEVCVLGSQERSFESFREKTEYIIEFRRKNSLFRHCAYLNYREIFEIYQEAAKIAGENALPKLQKLNLFEKKTKTIETRKIMIESFLWALLSQGKTQENAGLLQKLGLSEEFFEEKAEESREFCEKSAENCENREKCPQFSSSPQKKRGFSKKASMSQILKLSSCENRNFFCESRGNSERHVAEIFLMDGNLLSLTISAETTAKEACFAVAKALNLDFFDDFRLISAENGAFLAEDELLLRFCLPKAYLQEKSRRNCEFFRRFSLQMRASLQFLKKKPQVFFKKAVFLDPAQEQIDWNRDPVRRKLVFSQVCKEISQGFWGLKANDYALFAAFFVLDAENQKKSCENRGKSKVYGEISAKIEENREKPQKIEDFIPKAVFSAKNAEFWSSQISRKAAKLREKFVEKAGKICDFQAFVQGNLLKFAGKQSFFGNLFYECEVYKDETLKFVEILAVNRENIKLLSRDREVLREISLKSVRDLKVFPKSLVFAIENKGELRVNCGKSFEISQFIRNYQRILESCEEF